MTSGVKQALPQVLMPKAGIEAKAARNRASHGDFAETLGIGKFAKQQKSGEAKADRQETEARPPWQRLAAKLDTAIDHTQGVGQKLAVALPEPDPEKKPAAELPADDFESAAKDLPEIVTIKQTPDAASILVPYSQAAVVSARPVDARNPEDLVAKDVPADDRPALSRSSVEGTVPKDRDQSATPALPTAKSDPVPPAATRFGTASPFIAAAAEPAAAADATKEKDAKTESIGDTAKPAPRVTVLAQQNISAPMPSTAIVLVESIAANDLLEPAKTVLSLDAIHASAAPASAQSLKIQLHPAELGMVTATLRFAGEQLSIELQVENHEAYRRLTSDSDTIVSSLRDLGYDIERVTVLQPSIASSPTGRSDAGASIPSPQGRAPDQFGSGTTGGGNGGTGSRQSENNGNTGRSGSLHPATARENQGTGLYI
jgi:chemotaxis protein MotD